MLKTVFLVLGGVLTATAIVPYMIDTINKRTKPRVVTWFNWALITGVATVAAFSDKQYPSAALTFAGAIACMMVAIFGFKHGDRKFGTLDMICQLGTILGLILWAIFDSPLVAIVATVAVDFTAAVPTLVHCWQKPHEETTITYIVTIISALFTLAAVNHPHASGLVFPIYIVCLDTTFTTLLLTSPRRHDSQPA